MRIGIAQINTRAGAFSETVDRMVAQSQRAAEQGVELLVFPLAALAGVEALPYSDRLSFLRDAADAVATLAEQLACPAIVPVPMEASGPDGFFEVLLVERGEVRPLRMASQFDSSAKALGREAEVPEFAFGGLRFALALSQSDLDVLDDYDNDVDATLYLSGYPFAMDDLQSTMGANLVNARFVDDAQDMGAWLVGVASVGCYGEEVFTGSSFVVDPTGKLVACAPAFEEALLVADLAGSAEPLVPDALFPEVFDAPFHLWQATSLGIHDFATKNGFTDVALCLDGSLNALVLAALAVDALGPLHVHVLVGVSAGPGAAACREFAHRLRVDCTSAAGVLPIVSKKESDQLELAALARETGSMVLASYDKTALAIAAADCMAGPALLCPLGDIYRSDVLDMAHVRNTISPLFRRVELGEGDTLALAMPDGSLRQLASEQEITAVDEVLLDYIEYDHALADQVGEHGRDSELVRAVLAAERSGELYRRALPPVLAMSTRTLDDARFPLGVGWNDQHLDRPSGPVELYGGAAADSVDIEPTGEDRVHYEKAPEPMPKHDIDATLSMLRDLAEQSGFSSQDLVPLNPAAIEGLSSEDFKEGGKLPGWMSPFSEN